MSRRLILWERIKGYTSTHMTLRSCHAGLRPSNSTALIVVINVYTWGRGGGSGVLRIMAYTGRLQVYERVQPTSLGDEVGKGRDFSS